MMRLLLALTLPDASIDKISTLRRPIAGVAWHFPYNYLISLSFLGDVQSRTLLSDIDHVLGFIRSAPFNLVCSGLGFTSLQDSGQIWVDVGLSPELRALKSKIDYALRRIGVEITKRRFRPRVTIGHCRGVPSIETLNWVNTHNLFKCDGGTVTRLSLVSCNRLDGTPYYEQWATYDLTPHHERPLTTNILE